MRALRRLGLSWRHLLRWERPGQALVRWRANGLVSVLLACLLVGMINSWPLLMEPSLQVGGPSPFTLRAPKDARVIDSAELELRRSQSLPRTQVQVIDTQANLQLRGQLERRLQQVRQQRSSLQPRIDPVDLNTEERRWLSTLMPDQVQSWENAVLQAQQRMLSQGLNGTLSDGVLEQAAKLQLEGLSEPGRSLGARLLADGLRGRSNLRPDSLLNQQRLVEIVSQRGLPTIHVRHGDLIVHQGEPLSSQALDVLDYFGLSNRRPRPLLWLRAFLYAASACGVMVLVMRRWRASLEPRQALLALAMLLVVQLVKLQFGVHVSPLALLLPPTLLIAQGLGTMAGLVWLAIASLLWPYGLPASLVLRLLIAAAVAALAALLAGRQRNRAQLLQLALLLPLAAGLLQALALQLGLLNSAGGASAGGPELFSETLVVLGLLLGGLLLSPLIESSFGLLTRARLMELADLERPLLRRLSTEAPGTFEHTLMICGLAEEGARAIQADVDLIRTGALYHDVGKLLGPQWFIENQDGVVNPHDELNDPFGSAAILQAHVDEGLRLARRHHLPRPLADFIPEHQGTLKMGYFLHQARQRDPSVPEERFRYRGPIPRSRETAILMLADGCEAALRSLPPDTTEADAHAMVRRLVEARLSDGQLAASGLSRAELELVIRAFVRVWRRMRHRRIPYPISPRKAFSA
ncbi:MAG: HDIG domain-containing protein [Synechococcaceae cyanobacterium]|nr:HDIG domain-containing protein [Synechococcaceae cyanobacterium]